MRKRNRTASHPPESRGPTLEIGAWVIVAVIVVVLQSCSPTVPAGAEIGVTVYELSNYQGQARRLGADERDFDDVVGPCGSGNWDDCISSIRVPAGWQAILYEHPDFDGRSLTLTSDMDDLRRESISGWNGCGGDWENCASSIRVSQQ